METPVFLEFDDDLDLSALFDNADDIDQPPKSDAIDELEAMPAHSTRLQDALTNLKSIRMEICNKASQFQGELNGLRIKDRENALLTPSLQDDSEDYVLAQEAPTMDKTSESYTTRARSPTLGPTLDSNDRAVKSAAPAKPHRGSVEHARKVELERQDYTLRNKLAGLDTLTTMVDNSISTLQLRAQKCKTLNRMKRKLENGEEWDENDAEKVDTAGDEIEEGSAECEEIEGMTEVLRTWLETGQVE